MTPLCVLEPIECLKRKWFSPAARFRVFQQESIRHRTRRSKGCLTRDGMLHMMFKLGLCAEGKWRKLRGFDYLAKVIRGVEFKDEIEVESDNQVAA